MSNKNPVSASLKSKPGLLAIFLLASFTLASCLSTGGPLPKNRVFKLGKHRAWLEEPSASDPFFKERTFNHPYRLTPEAMAAQIQSFRYKGLALLSKKKRVFPSPAGNEITALLLIALDKASPREIIKFTYHQEGGDTKGDLFIISDKIHWRFHEIQGKEYSRDGSRNWLDTWKLIPAPGQKYRGTAGLLGSSPIKNWLVLSLDKAAPLAASDSPSPEEAEEEKKEEGSAQQKPAAKESGDLTKKEPAKGEDKNLERALQRLKKLREQDLITEEEYKKKKADLLREGF